MKIGTTEAIRKPCLSGIRIASLQTLALSSVVYLRQRGEAPPSVIRGTHNDIQDISFLLFAYLCYYAIPSSRSLAFPGTPFLSQPRTW